MYVFERKVNGRRYRIAAQSVWDPARGRSVARQVVLGPATPPPVADLGTTRTVDTRAVGDVGALILNGAVEKPSQRGRSLAS